MDVSNARMARRHLGELLLAQGHLEEANAHLAQALTLAQHMGLRREVALSSWHMGRVRAQQGDQGQALALMQVCVDFYQEVSHAKAAQYAEHLAELRAGA